MVKYWAQFCFWIHSEMNYFIYSLLTTILGISLIYISIVDCRRYIIPDTVSMPLAVSGLLLNFVLNNSVLPYLSGALIGYAVFWLIIVSRTRLGLHPGMGFGDAKLLAAGGAWCGVLALPVIVALASLSALIYAVIRQLIRRRRLRWKSRVPFGPFLALGIFVAWLMALSGFRFPFV